MRGSGSDPAASDAIWRSLGGEPVHVFGAASDEARANGELDGIDSFMTNGGPGDIITSNVTPYAKTNALFLSKRAAQALSDAQLGILRQAAAEALGTSLAELPVTDDPADFCAAGGQAVLAQPADLEAMIAATKPVRDAMEQDPATRDFIARIEELKSAAQVASAPSATCGGSDATAASDPDPFPVGTYTTVATNQDALRAGVQDGCAAQG